MAEDNTCVLKILNEINNWGPPQQSSTGIDFTAVDITRERKSSANSFLNDSLSPGKSPNASSNRNLSRASSNQSRATKPLTTLAKKRNYTAMELDINKQEAIVARAKLCKISDEMQTLQTRNAEKEIEMEKERQQQLNRSLKEQTHSDELRRQYKSLHETNENQKEELTETQTRLDTFGQTVEEERKRWQTERRQLRDRIDELEEKRLRELSEIKKKNIRSASDIVVLRQDVEETQRERDSYKKRYKELAEQLNDYEDLKFRCQCAEQRVKVLENESQKLDESQFIVKASHAELAKLKTLKRENKTLRGDNELYRESSELKSILEERNTNLNEKLCRAEKIIEHLRSLEFENNRLKEMLSEFEVKDITGENKARTPLELKRMVSTLQDGHLKITKEHSSLKANFSIIETSLKETRIEAEHLRLDNTKLKNEKEILEDSNRKQERRLKLVTTERDGVRRVLASYENNESLQTQNESEVAVYKSRIAELEGKLSSTEDSEALRTKCSELESTIEKLKQEKTLLEVLLKRCGIRGEYDPTKTKVICFVGASPLERAHQAHKSDVENIKTENHNLRKKVIKLQQEASELDESMNVSVLIKSSKHMQDTQSQLEKAQKMTLRLKEEFAVKMKSFREAVFNIFGYKIYDMSNGHFKIRSQYAGPDDFFMFSKNGETMGVTDYTSQWEQTIEDYLQTGDSTPAFIASVTLELFSRQTHLQNMTVATKARQL